MLDTLCGFCKQRIADSDWPDSGRTTALNIATRCASLSNISPGQQAYGLVAAVFVYGSEDTMVVVQVRKEKLRTYR
jgi:hypothetical protein